MRTRALAASMLLVGGVAPASAQEPAADPLAPRLAALLQEYRPASAGMREAATDLQRREAVERLAAYPDRFVDLAAERPDDPAALEVLRWAVQALASTDSAAQIAWEANEGDFPAGGPRGSAGRIVALLSEHHAQSAALAPVLDRIRYAYRLEFAPLLERLAAESPHREVRAVACLSLASFLQDRLRMARLVEDRPELAGCYGRVFGEDYLPRLRELERTGLADRVEALFERAATELGDVELRGGETVAQRAAPELYAIRHLGIGQTAPELTGRDQHGEPLALSDYRGQVVLLYFWSEY